MFTRKDPNVREIVRREGEVRGGKDTSSDLPSVNPSNGWDAV